jgi:hypothetical protein
MRWMPDLKGYSGHGWSRRKSRILHLDYSTESIVSYLMHHCTQEKKDALDMLYPDAVFN